MTRHRPRFMCCSKKLPVPPQGPSKFRGPRFLSFPPPGRAPVPEMELISFRLQGVERICRWTWTPRTRGLGRGHTSILPLQEPVPAVMQAAGLWGLQKTQYRRPQTHDPPVFLVNFSSPGQWLVTLLFPRPSECPHPARIPNC